MASHAERGLPPTALPSRITARIGLGLRDNSGIKCGSGAFEFT
jgi:hypothetical protein